MTPAHRVPLEGEAPAEPCSRALLTGKGSAEVSILLPTSTVQWTFSSAKFLKSSRAGRTAAGIGPLRMKKPVIDVRRKLPCVERIVTSQSKNGLP